MESILLADQDQRTREEIVRFLRICGYRVILANNGDAVIAQLEASEPNLILLDIFLPPTSGIMVLKSLRETEGIGEIPILF